MICDDVTFEPGKFSHNEVNNESNKIKKYISATFNDVITMFPSIGHSRTCRLSRTALRAGTINRPNYTSYRAMVSRINYVPGKLSRMRALAP